MAKNLLITHTDLDGISPIILLKLTNLDFEYKSIEISEIPETFDKIFDKLNKYENIFITDLTIPDEIYQRINEANINNVKVFDHHESHLDANKYPYVNVSVMYNNLKTSATELFYEYLKSIYPELNTKSIAEYVKYVRELDTFTFTSDIPRDLESIRKTYGNLEFVKSITRRLKRNKDEFKFNTFEKKLTKIKKEEITRYMQRKEKEMLKATIDGKKCAIIFCEQNKSELGNYISNKYSEFDLVILIDASARISYRTCKDDVNVNEFAANYSGGGHAKASGSSFDDEYRKKIIESYFKKVKW